MADSKDILVGYTLKPNEDPEKLTQSFDGENEGISQQPVVSAFAALKGDLQTAYNKFAKETKVIETIIKPFN